MSDDERVRRDDENADGATGRPKPAEEDPARHPEKEPPETARRPAPGIEHEPEPSGENLIPAKERPGTL